jgi:MFS transporter, DHA1 family, inner membrane transport protein
LSLQEGGQSERENSATSIPILLLIFGVGVFIGNVAGGRFADRNLDKELAVELSGLFIVLLVFSITAHSKVSAIICLLMMGLFGFAPASALRLRVLHYSAESPSIASGANIASFNIGNALGAWLGGLLISSKFGYVSPLWGATGITSISVLVLILAQIQNRKLRK